MKKRVLIVLLMVLLAVLPAAADDLQDATLRGVLRLGVCPDYVPFVFYNESGAIDGIDVALIQEVARRMGLKFQAVDLAFDGLIDSLNVNQVDVIAGALSITEERKERIDFTRPYYNGNAQFIVKQAHNVPTSVTLDSFRGMRVGVKKGTSFESWVRTNLANAGVIGAGDIFTYATVIDAMKALDRGDVDCVMMDQDVYSDKFQGTNNYKVFYTGFSLENYAFGIRKNSSLTPIISSHLNDMIKDGTAQQIANRYFGKNYNTVDATVIRPSQLVTPTPVPYVPSSQPVASCTNSMTFVADVTVKDGTTFKQGERFRKTWRVYNNGSCAWNPSYSFVFVSGSSMGGNAVSIPTTVKPGQTIDISVDLTAPNADGSYTGYWQMRSPYGQNFGQTVYTKINVRGRTQPVQPTAVPTKRPQDGQNNPTHPNVTYFYPSSYSGMEGDCVSLYWSCTDTSIVEIKIDGKSVYKQGMGGDAGYFCEVSSPGSHYIELHAFSVYDDAYSSFTYTTQGKPSGGSSGGSSSGGDVDDNTNRVDEYIDQFYREHGYWPWEEPASDYDNDYDNNYDNDYDNDFDDDDDDVIDAFVNLLISDDSDYDDDDDYEF